MDTRPPLTPPTLRSPLPPSLSLLPPVQPTDRRTGINVAVVVGFSVSVGGVILLFLLVLLCIVLLFYLSKRVKWRMRWIGKNA